MRRNLIIFAENNVSIESFYATRNFLVGFSAWQFGHCILGVSSDEALYCVSKWSRLSWKVNSIPNGLTKDY